MDPMTEADWRETYVLRPKGLRWQYGDVTKISRRLVLELDRYLHRMRIINYAVYGNPLITCGTQGQHAANSRHYEPHCDAADLIFQGCKLSDIPLAVQVAIVQFNFGGVGAYDFWRLAPSLPPCGGLHLDMRPIAEHKAQWLRTRVINGNGVVTGEVDVALSNANLNRLFGHAPEKQWQVNEQAVVGLH